MKEASGAVTRWFETPTGSDELKNAEAERHSPEERFRLLIENASDLITVVNAEGMIRFQSPASERVLGYRPAELLNRSCFEFIHPDDHARGRASIQRVLRDPIPASPIEYRVRHKGGTWLVMQSIGRQLPAEGFESVLVVNSRDVTAQKHLEAQLRQAQKLEAIGQLAGGVAHDFNNLLLVITGHSALLAQDKALKGPSKNSVIEILRAAEQAAGLTQQLLAFSRQQLLTPKLVDLNSVVSETRSLLRRLIGEDVHLVTELQRRLRPVKVDPSQLQQVILNLAVNARDAMPQGGTLTLKTRNLALESPPQTDPLTPGQVLLEVIDTGCGMTPEVQARIFEPFFTTKPEGKGTGLGLAVAHGIIQQSGGRIQVRSHPGAGTAVSIYLPAAKGPVEKPKKSAPGKSAKGKETILLAEDEEAVRHVTARILETFGYRVLQARSGEEALSLAQNHPDTINLLLADVVMPGMSGRQLADALHARNPGLKVLFQSGYTDDAVLRHGVIQAEVAFLQKPFTPNALAKKVRQMLERP
jgi:two-component system, cell cycle sensor histidine kinase and response regulator CckA